MAVDAHSLFFLLFFLVIVGPVKAAYVPLGEDQAIRSSFLVSKSGSIVHSPVDFVWSFPVSPQLACIQLLGVFEHFAEYYIAQLERSRPDLLVVVVLDLMLIILDAEQSLIASLFVGVQRVEQHVTVELNVLWHF